MHLGHCLHNLYHSVTCNADMTIRVMRWHPDLLLPSPVDHEHECMNWDLIDEWAKERYVDTATPGLLVHPTRGKHYSYQISIDCTGASANASMQEKYSLVGSM